jgi:hypothetical protein
MWNVIILNGVILKYACTVKELCWGSNISDEVEKYKNEAKGCKNEAEKYKSKLGRQKKFWSVERKYQFTLICS